MRRFLTILAMTAVTAVPSLTIAKNPFDFSDWVRKSQSDPDAGEGATSSPEKQSRSLEKPSVEPSSDVRSIQPSKNYRDELFGGGESNRTNPHATEVSERPNPWNPPQYRRRLPEPESTTIGRPRLKDRPAPAGSFTRDDLQSSPASDFRNVQADEHPTTSSEDTLQRFDEFLRSQKVVNAGYEATEESESGTVIQPVSDTSTADPFWDSEAASAEEAVSDDRDALPTIQAKSPAGPEQETDRFSFIEKEPLPEEPQQEKPLAGNRLTETIPTAPGSRGGQPQKAQEDPIFKEVNPFAIGRPSPKSVSADRKSPTNAPADRPIMFDGEADDQPTRSRLSITRTGRGTPAPVSDSVTPLAQPATADTDQRNADILVVWSPTGPLNVGQECACDLQVTNQRKTPAEDVTIDAVLPESLRLVDAVPAPVAVDGVLSWDLDLLAPGEQRTIQVKVLPAHPGSVNIATYVRLTESKRQSLTVAEPQLFVEISGPQDVTVGEPATQTVTVRNPGSGVATNVKLEARVPEGLEHVGGRRLMMNIGSLNPGESRRVRLPLAAVAGGQQVLQVEARADAGLVQTASAEVVVVAPKLDATITGPGLRYLGREATYILRVSNVGEAETDAVQVQHHIPEGFDFVRSDRGAQFNENSRMLTWFVGRLGTDEPQELKVTLVAKQVGEFEQAVRATAAHGSISDARMVTRVEGTPSLVIEVDDLDDPVEVGRETAYEITITNEGTASSHDVNLACELPAGLTFIKAVGPVEHRAGANGIVFDPIAEVRAGESLNFRIFVKGTVHGDKRFRCRLTSLNLSQPLFTEESTKFYGE